MCIYDKAPMPLFSSAAPISYSLASATMMWVLAVFGFALCLLLFHTFYASAVYQNKICKSELALRSLLRNSNTNPRYHFLVTDNLEKFKKISYYFLGQHPQSIELVDLTEEDAERFKI